MTAATAPAPPLGEGEELVPGYEVLGLLSRGADLDVYDCWSEERDCRCVAKTPRPDRLASTPVRRRLLREGRLLRRLAHPHLVRAYEALSDPRPVIVLETLGGETLSHVVRAGRRRLAAGDAVHLGLQVASAVRYLHRHDVLHLDLKPSNVICEEGGRAKLFDLSVARRPGRAPAGVGTRQYLAPEQARGGVLGPAADVWGLGATLYEAVTARRPFGTGEGNGRFEQLERRADPVRAHRRLPRELSGLIDACLEPAPEDRPSLPEATAALDALADRIG